MNWEKVKIGDIFNIEKGVLQSSKCTPGDYTFITAAEEWKTHNTYSHDCEALIFAAAASGSLGRTHYINGKFISSDLCYILTVKDEVNYPLDIKFYHFVFNNLKETIVKATKTGTSKEAINYTNFYNYELYYFDLEQQHFWIEKLLNVDETRYELLKELDQQQTYLQLLRQTISQEAVQGKLTKQDPTDEPATELLKRIKAEKEKLIKAGKLKKEKELPLITEDEISLELPEGWVWCRLGEIGEVTGGIQKTPLRNPVKNIYPYLRVANVQRGSLVLDEIEYFELQEGELERWKLLKDDLLIVEGNGSPNEIGRCAIWTGEIDNCVHQNHLIRFRGNRLSSEYILTYLNSPNGKNIMKKKAFTTTGLYTLSVSKISSILFPLPPLAEQQRIVAKVNQLQQQLSQLEGQVQQSREYAQQLLQSVLKEAFEQKGKVYEMEEQMSMVAEGNIQ